MLNFEIIVTFFQKCQALVVTVMIAMRKMLKSFQSGRKKKYSEKYAGDFKVERKKKKNKENEHQEQDSIDYFDESKTKSKCNQNLIAFYNSQFE